MTLNETTLVNANNNAARFVTLLAARVDAARSNLAGDLRRLVEEAQKAIEDLEAGRSWAAFGRTGSVRSLPSTSRRR